MITLTKETGQTRHGIGHLATSTLLAFAALTSSGRTQSYALTGPGCSGSSGVPSLDSTDLPRIGSAFSATVTNAAPTSLIGVFALGFTNPNAPIPGAPGCVLLTDATALEVVLLNGGSASSSLTIPASLPLIGLSLFQQAFVFEPGSNQFGFVASNGRRIDIGNFANPVVNSVSTQAVTGGGTVTIRGLNLIGGGAGTGTCLRVIDAQGRSVLFRAQSATVDPTTGEDVIVARAPAVAAQFAGTLQVLTGVGSEPVIAGDPWLTAPVNAYAWGGMANVGTAGPMTVNTSPGIYVAGAVTSLANGCVSITIPLDPCNNGGLYPAFAEVNLDFHGFYTCGNIQSDFDLFGMQVANNPFGVFCQNVAFSLRNQLQVLLGNDFVVTVNPSNLCEILVCPAPGCTFNLGWGNLVIKC